MNRRLRKEKEDGDGVLADRRVVAAALSLCMLYGGTRAEAERLKPGEEAKKHIAPPIEDAAIDLSPYAGRTIVLELGLNGNNGGSSETTQWHAPRLEAIGKP